MKKPNLFIVGMAKAGSTSLYYYLKEHPEIYFPSEVKEPRYFNKEGRGKYVRTKKDYLDLYENVKDEKIIGDASISYLRGARIDKKIKKFNSDAKIIIIIRDPESWLISVYNQKYRDKKEVEDINDLLSRKNDFEKLLKKNYKNVKDYKKTFGNNLKIIFHSDLKNKTLETYREILKFLDVKDKSFIPTFKEYNVHGKPRSKLLSNFKKFLRKNLPLFSKIWKNVVTVYIRHSIQRKKTSKPELNSEVKKRIKREFKPYVKELEEITKRPLLKEWNIE